LNEKLNTAYANLIDKIGKLEAETTDQNEDQEDEESTI